MAIALMRSHLSWRQRSKYSQFAAAVGFLLLDLMMSTIDAYCFCLSRLAPLTCGAQISKEGRSSKVVLRNACVTYACKHYDEHSVPRQVSAVLALPVAPNAVVDNAV